jgi:hypothetical protein
MSWLTIPGRPELQVASDAEGVNAYPSPAALADLHAIDNTLVDQVLSLGRTSGWRIAIGRSPLRSR